MLSRFLDAHAGDKDLNRSLQAENAVITALNSSGVPAVHQPKVPLFSASGSAVEPDGGALLGLTDRPLISKGQPLDVLIEVKIQETGGSADQKLEATISRYAQLRDTYGYNTVIVHSLCPRAVGEDYLAQLEALAAVNLVGFIRVEDLTRASFEAEVLKMEEQYQSVQANIAEIADTFPPELLAAAARLQLASLLA